MFEIKDNLRIELVPDDILTGQGIDPAKASAKLYRTAAEVLDEANSLLKPAALYGTLPVTDFQHEEITFAGGTFSGSLVARAFAGASKLALALCTIGTELEERATEVMSTDMIHGIALDGAGTAAVGKLSRLLREEIVYHAEKTGFKAGMKANPGQEGWPIWQQQTFFSLVPAEKIGVTLNKSCLM
ncbi:MAG: hypothetical protein GX881_01685, partial [Firmicutes bacterium]|nr:hypothetical protein [Bacillota bacterium]